MALKLKLHDSRTGNSDIVDFAGGEMFVGKSSDNGIVLERAGVSRRHCMLECHGDACVVRDLNSRNGTYLNGGRLPPDSPVAFLPGQTLQIGDFSLQIIAGANQSLEGPEGGISVTPTPSQVTPPPQPQVEEAHIPKGPRRITPVGLKKRIHAALLERMDLKHTDMSDQSNDELREHATQVCQAVVQSIAGQLPDWLSPAALVREVVNEAVGLGLIEDLLEDEDVDEIMVCAWNKIYVERKGRLELTDQQFMDDAQVIAIIRRILAPLGRRIDETSPMADGRLADGSRVNAIIPPLALSGPTLTIRKFAKEAFTIEDYFHFKSMIPPMAKFLELAVRNRANIIISGGTGSGKTTLLNVTSNFIPKTERIVTIEDAAELQLQQNHVVRLESRPANIEGRNAINIRELVKNSLRMRPDRIVVGECRGGEALDMLQAMNTGHDGSLTTLHANSPRDALARLETLVLMSGMELPSRAIREQIASAVDFIMQVSRLPDGSRKITAITGVAGMQGDVVTLQNIFQYEQEGYDSDGRVKGYFKATGQIPDFVQTLRHRGIEVDMGMFTEKESD